MKLMIRNLLLKQVLLTDEDVLLFYTDQIIIYFFSFKTAKIRVRSKIEVLLDNLVHRNENLPTTTNITVAGGLSAFNFCTCSSSGLSKSLINS